MQAGTLGPRDPPPGDNNIFTSTASFTAGTFLLGTISVRALIDLPQIVPTERHLCSFKWLTLLIQKEREWVSHNKTASFNLAVMIENKLLDRFACHVFEGLFFHVFFFFSPWIFIDCEGKLWRADFKESGTPFILPWKEMFCLNYSMEKECCENTGLSHQCIRTVVCTDTIIVNVHVLFGLLNDGSEPRRRTHSHTGAC